MTVDVSHFARLRGQRYIERVDVSATHGNDPGTYLHPGQGIDPPYLTDDITFSSNSFTVVPTLSFPVTVDTDYGFHFHGTYTSHDLGTGLVLGLDLQDGASGNFRAMVEVCHIDATTISREWLTDNTATGFADVDVVDSARHWAIIGRLQCTASGTMYVRRKRGGADHNVTIQAGSCGIVSGF